MVFVPWGCLHCVEGCSVDAETRTTAILRVLTEFIDMLFENADPQILVALNHILEVILLVRHACDLQFIWLLV